MRYDLNYLIYSALLVEHLESPEALFQYISSSSAGLNIIIIKDGDVIKKYPDHFFPLPNKKYSTISDGVIHPYQSDGDFEELTTLLGLQSTLPSGIKEASWGEWQGEYYADYVETWDGYKYYIITASKTGGDIEPVGGFVWTWGLAIGVVFILIFVALTYNYIRIRLRPIQLMKARLLDLERGDLESKIKIMGTDELAELSISFNKLISEIKDLIDKKHRLLLDVSHELKSPLARMLLLVEMIPQEHKQTAELKEEIEFLNDMISNLLLTDKLDVPYSQLELKTVRPLVFFNKIVGFFNQEQQKKIHIASTLSQNDEMLIDETKMIICIKNILQNAFKYANTKKGISVVIEKTPIQYLIGIRDYGPGISKEDQKHVFESFYRAKNIGSISGFGLGLAISKKIITAHNGDILIDNKIDVGTKFILTLPKGGGRDK